MPLGTGSLTPTKSIGIVRVSRWRATVAKGPACHDDVGLQTDQLLRERSYPIDVIALPLNIHPRIAASVQPKPASGCVNAES